MISEKLLVGGGDSSNGAVPSPPSSPLLRRASTFDAFSKNFENGVNQLGSGFERTFSQLVDYVDPDLAYTSALIADYKKHANDGVVGDVPFPPGN
jgi:hypothetical protein